MTIYCYFVAHVELSWEFCTNLATFPDKGVVPILLWQNM